MISRRILTDTLLAAIGEATDYPVRDAQPPDVNFGWSGQPGEKLSTFTPYTILTPQASSTSSGPLSGTQDDWRLMYGVSSFGTSRAQCEWIADLARSAFASLHRTTFDGIDATYTIMQVRLETIGSVQRSDAVNPSLFAQTDMICVWATKGS
jgi:hypothetical protein